MTNAICTYCAKPKRTDSPQMPAVRRYLSPRIDQLHESAQKQGAIFFILSGRYGLLSPEQMIPWYDHLLSTDEVETMVPSVAAELTRLGISRFEYHTADPGLAPQVVPYLEVVTQACRVADIDLVPVILPGDPV